MGSGGKGGGAGTQTYDYYGTIAAVIRAGPIDTLHALLMDGKTIWSGPISRADAGVGNPYSLLLTNSRLLHNGYVRLYWGDDDQIVADPALPDHPPYRGFAYLVFKNFLFGRERTAAPNLEVIAEARPRPPVVVIPATAADGSTGCMNPIAILADLLTSVHGAALPATRLDPESWQGVHDYFALTMARRGLAYCAPLLTSQAEVAAVCKDLLSLCDAGLRLKPDGAIEVFHYPADPGNLGQYAVLTANDLTEPLSLEAQTWDKVPTGVVVQFSDGARFDKESSLKVDDLRALQQALEPRRETLRVPFVTREAQARKLGAEWIKRKCQPQGEGRIKVRPERAVNLDGKPLRVGNRFLLDVDPEPGGDGVLQMCRVMSRRVSLTGPIEISFATEANQPAIPFSPGWTPQDLEEASVGAIEHARIIPFPLSLNAGEPAAAVLAARGDDGTIGADVLFDVDAGEGTFTSLGTQLGFAVRCRVVADYDADATGTVRLELLDTRDQHLALSEPGESGAANNELLLVIYKLNGDFIDEDAAGSPVMEILSIVTSTAVGGNAYDFTVLRSRLGSAPFAWDADDQAWIIPRTSLLPMEHANFPTYAQNGNELVLRLSPFSRDAEFEGEFTNLPFRFPSRWKNTPQAIWTTPDTNPILLASDGNLTPAATVSDKDGNLTRLTLYSKREDTGAQTKHVEVLFPPTSSMTLAEAFALGGTVLPLNFAGAANSDTYYTLTIRAEDGFGNVYESERSLVRGPSSGIGGLLPPSLNPASGRRFEELARVSVTVAAPARIHYAGQLWNDRTSQPPATYKTTAGQTVIGTSSFSFRLWCRATTGAVHSAWVKADYIVENDWHL